MKKNSKNIDQTVVDEFGLEWSRFDQSHLTADDLQSMFDSYFHIFPWDSLPENAEGADIGCGSGRWANVVAQKVAHLHLVDPSIDALTVAKRNMAKHANVTYHNGEVDRLPFNALSLDFAYALGVLHHVPDTQAAILSISKVLKPGAPFLIYLYYAFDNRPFWFRVLWKISDLLRRVISVMPAMLKNVVTDLIALLVYFPLARSAKVLEKVNCLPDTWPLKYYRDRSFYVLRTDSLDRFGTRLEQRFTKVKIKKMLETAGFHNIQFSDKQPLWTAIAFKKP